MTTRGNAQAENGNRVSGVWELESTEEAGRGNGNLPLNSLTLHWIAKLEPFGTNGWKGNIFYKDGDTSMFPYNFVTIEPLGLTLRNAKVVY